MSGAMFVAAGSPCLSGDVDIGEGASRAVPPDEVAERSECPSTGPEPSTAVAAVEPTVPEPNSRTSCPDCADEKADEGVVSAKRPVNKLRQSGWQSGIRQSGMSSKCLS